MNDKGVTLTNLIIVIGIILVIGAAAVVWLDPAAKIGSAKDEKRRQDILVIADALHDYANDHNGVLPILGAVSSTVKTVLCSTQSASPLTCDGDSATCLSIDDERFTNSYLRELPHDPDKSSAADTGYYLYKDSNGFLEVGACSYASTTITHTLPLKVNCPVYGGGYCWYLGDQAANNTCAAECASKGLTCKGLLTMYGEDDAYCQINKAFNTTTCADACAASSVLGVGPGVYNFIIPDVIESYSCYYKKSSGLDCLAASGSSYYAICPCQ